MNTIKTVFLMGLMTGLFLFVGHLIGGQTGMTVALVIAILMNFGAYWYSHKLVLSMNKAKELNPEQAPELYGMVQNLATRAELPMPKVYLINNNLPNAFATGRNPDHAVVAVTSGLLNNLNRDEISAVIGHELAHIKNRDMLTQTIAAAFAGAITYIAHIAGWMFMFGGDDDEGGIGSILMIILAPVAAVLLQMALSRSREFAADKDGSSITGNPIHLASALQKLHNTTVRSRGMKNVEPSTASLFIVNPLSGGRSFSKLFSTHPPVEERIEKLKALAR